MFCVNTEVMSIHKCKWSDSLVVRWQLTDQAYPDRNLEKPFFNINLKQRPFLNLRLFPYFTSFTSVAFVLIIS